MASCYPACVPRVVALRPRSMPSPTPLPLRRSSFPCPSPPASGSRLPPSYVRVCFRATAGSDGWFSFTCRHFIGDLRAVYRAPPQTSTSTSTSDRLQALPKVLPSWSEVPTLFQLERQFRRTKKGKAFFVDGIQGDLLACAPRQMARLFYEAFLKEALFRGSPIYTKPIRKETQPKLPTTDPFL